MCNFKMSHIEALQSALRRLKPTHPKRSFLETELHKAEAGKRGEMRLMKKFDEFYSKEDYAVMWNVELSLNKWRVQMDGLLLTRYAAIIIESKNISDKLYFNNETSEFYRINSAGEKTVMDNPATQVEKHIRFLKEWFRKHSIALPVTGILVFTAKQAELITIPEEIPVCKVHQVIEKIFKLLNRYPIAIYPDESIKEIEHSIRTKQSPYTSTPLADRYFIDPAEFTKGIYCEHCKTPTIIRLKRAWICKTCRMKDDQALHKTVAEYFALVSRTAANRDIQKFALIDNRHLIKRFFSNSSLPGTGHLRDRSYSRN